MKFKKEYYDDMFNEVSEDTPDAHCMEFAYNDNDILIGSPNDAAWLMSLGIEDPEPATPAGAICLIGFSETENRWYGWSHRAYASFGIGSHVKLGDCAFVPSNTEEFLENVKNWFEEDMYQNLEFQQMRTGIAVSYDLVCQDGTVIASGEFLANPKNWGKGEWTAATLEDAKQMAIDFALDVS